MGKVCTILVLFSMIIAMPVVEGIEEGPKAVEEWFQNLSNYKEKVTKLHFYFHDTITGKNLTAVQVAQANSTFASPTSFGLIRVMDDLLTVGPGPKSKVLGRAQGLFAFASMEEIGLLMTLNFVFTDGVYNGSTLSVQGRNPILQKYREMSIVAGSGVFRLARGIVTAKTTWFNVASGNAVVEYNLIVIHY